MNWRDEQNKQEARRAELKAMQPIVRNAILLADLERQWSVLGPLRPITYTIYINNSEQNARAFEIETKALGFDTSLGGAEGKWYLDATRCMEPTAENVTHWEEWFKARIAARDYTDDEQGHFVRWEEWSYPKTVSPTFTLNGFSGCDTGARDRARILFGETLCFDPVSAKGRWSGFRGPTSSPPPFRIVPSQFLNKARAQRPVNMEPTASKFAQWLYSLYGDAFGNARDRENGKKAEEAILAARRGAYTCVDAEILSDSFPDWRLVHNGMHVASSALPNYLTVDDLKVAGEALRVLPDLIYRNQRTGEIIIVEIKHSRMTIPSNLWPNIWGQLWCYAQLDQIRRAPHVTVIGEVWGDAWRDGNRKMSSEHLVCLRASVRRNPRVAAYDRFFRELFDIYRGDS